ncbi:Allergen Asp f 15 [Trametes pubescens]|uniref:Allergen Asp f 15 n=1 Tax=Trametes pubescens TaxID=154538 RepID=A0A1M2VFB7_TRAPU|nr:Allergen Asp f 15 [Trametes pubescens]
MQFASLLAALVTVPAVLGATTSVSFDPVFDNAANSLDIVACSDGSNGLLTKGFTTFGSLPSFPNIGGAPAVGGFNSAACGTCWQLTFNGTSINVLAIDVGPKGFNIAQEALDTLTHGNAVQLGRINATTTQVDASACGL